MKISYLDFFMNLFLVFKTLKIIKLKLILLILKTDYIFAFKKNKHLWIH